MESKPTDFKTLCAKGGERCDLHFLVENEVIQTKARVEKLEEKAAIDRDSTNKQINELSLQMKTYFAEQKYRDSEQKDVKGMTQGNTNDINELKSSIKSVEDRSKNVVEAIGRMERTVSALSSDIKDMDKTIINKDQVSEIVKNAIVDDKNTGRDKWFESLPAKVSAGVALLSFIAFFTIKIVVMLLAV